MECTWQGAMGVQRSRDKADAERAPGGEEDFGPGYAEKGTGKEDFT